MREVGFADFPGNPWAGIMAPPNMPGPIVGKLNATINDILHSPEAKESLAKLNVLLRPGSPEEFSAFVAKETPVWAEMVPSSRSKVPSRSVATKRKGDAAGAVAAGLGGSCEQPSRLRLCG